MKRGRPKKYDYDQIDRDILKFLEPLKTWDMKLGYPTKRIWEYINKFYRRKYSRAIIFSRLKSLEERGLVKRTTKYGHHYWKGVSIFYNGGVGFEFEHEVRPKLSRGKRFDFEFTEDGKLKWEEIRRKQMFRRNELKRLGLPSLIEIRDELPFLNRWDIVRFSPQELLEGYKKSLEDIKDLEKRRKICFRELEYVEKGFVVGKGGKKVYKDYGKMRPFIKEILLATMQKIEKELASLRTLNRKRRNN